VRAPYKDLTTKSKDEQQCFALSDKAFSRRRSLPLEHVVGLIFHTALEQNKSGYSLASRSYVDRLKGHLDLEPVSKSTVCEARQKLSKNVHSDVRLLSDSVLVQDKLGRDVLLISP
jgi:hypothetical protein